MKLVKKLTSAVVEASIWIIRSPIEVTKQPEVIASLM